MNRVIRLAIVCVVGAVSAVPAMGFGRLQDVGYDEDKVPQYTLPDLLVMATPRSGERPRRSSEHATGTPKGTNGLPKDLKNQSGHA